MIKELDDLEREISELEESLNAGLRLSSIKEYINTATFTYQQAMTDAAALYVYINLPDNAKKILNANVYFNIVTGTPGITFEVSDDGGNFYSKVYGKYTTSQSGIDISDDLDISGDNLIKVETDANTTLDFQVIVQFKIVL